MSPPVEKLGSNGKSVLSDNGVINDVSNMFPNDVRGKETGGGLGSVILPQDEAKSEASPSPSNTGKGLGLKKWRRIKREFGKGRDNCVAKGKMVIQEPSESSMNPNPSKRTQLYAERPPKSEDSVFSTNPLVLDTFAPFSDSENSEDRSSKSSTAGSIPNFKNVIPVPPGFSYDKSKMGSLSENKLIHSVQSGHQMKAEAATKARGEQVKIMKENSHCSVESDSRNFNFVFMQGAYATSNGTQNGGPVHYNGENGDTVKGSKQERIVGLRGVNRREGKVGVEHIFTQDVVSQSYGVDKKERGENHDPPSSDQDALDESISVLQSAQEALEKEVLKFKEISCDLISSDLLEFSSVEQEVQETRSEHFPSSEGVEEFFQAIQFESIESAKIDVGKELEDLFMRNIEVEVAYLVISKAIAATNKTSNSKVQNALDSEQNQIANKHSDIKNKVAMLKKETEKLETFCEDIASAGETKMLEKSVRKYTSYFVMQLLSLLVIVGFFMFRLSPNYVEVAPT